MRRLSVLLILYFSLPHSFAQAQIVRPIVSTEGSPIRELNLTARDGHEVFGAYRLPPGEGPFPAVIVLHPGNGPQPRELPRRGTTEPTGERLLAAGYATIWPTYRDRIEDPHALWDMLALTTFVKGMEQIDRNSVVIYGCSGGADLALDIASETSVAATVVEEGPLVLFTGIFSANRDMLIESGDWTPSLIQFMFEPERFLTDELREMTRAKIRAIDGPVLFAFGEGLAGVNGHGWLTDEFVVPELRAAGIEIEERVYPGEGHCFGIGGDTPGGQTFFRDMDAFFRRHVRTQPERLDESLITYIVNGIPQFGAPN